MVNLLSQVWESIVWFGWRHIGILVFRFISVCFPPSYPLCIVGFIDYTFYFLVHLHCLVKVWLKCTMILYFQLLFLFLGEITALLFVVSLCLLIKVAKHIPGLYRFAWVGIFLSSFATAVSYYLRAKSVLFLHLFLLQLSLFFYFLSKYLTLA